MLLSTHTKKSKSRRTNIDEQLYKLLFFSLFSGYPSSLSFFFCSWLSFRKSWRSACLSVFHRFGSFVVNSVQTCMLFLDVLFLVVLVVLPLLVNACSRCSFFFFFWRAALALLSTCTYLVSLLVKKRKKNGIKDNNSWSWIAILTNNDRVLNMSLVCFVLFFPSDHRFTCVVSSKLRRGGKKK